MTVQRRSDSGENNWKAKLTEADVLAIRAEYARGDTTVAAMARRFGVSGKLISCVAAGTHWRHVPGGGALRGHARGEKHHHAKLTEADVLAIRRAWTRGEASQTSMAAQYGVTQSRICQIVNDAAWKHLAATEQAHD